MSSAIANACSETARPVGSASADQVVAQTVAAYDRLAEAYAETWFADNCMEPLMERFSAFLPDGADVLDAGCGPGRDLRALLNRGLRPLGVDLSVAMLSEAKARVPEALLRRMDLRRLPLPSEAFDGVWCNSCLHHFSTDERLLVLRELARILKPDGLLALAVPEGLGTSIDALGRFTNPYSHEALAADLALANFDPLLVSRMASTKSTTGSTVRRTWIQAIARLRAQRIGSVGRSDATCLFCPENRFLVNRRAALPGPQATLYDDGCVTIMPDVAPLMLGHLLVVTKSHAVCIGACEPRTWHSLQKALRLIESAFREVYGRPMWCFEHGPAIFGSTSACVDHAHVHCLPGPSPIDDALHLGLGAPQRGNYEDLADFHRSGRSYLHIGGTGRPDIACVSDAIPSQFMRQLMATRLHRSRWRWQECWPRSDSRDMFAKTLDGLSVALDRRWLDVMGSPLETVDAPARP